jgi:hypothetical protein
LNQGEAALKTYLQCRPFCFMPKIERAYRRLGNIYLRKGTLDAVREQNLTALRPAPNDEEAREALKRLKEFGMRSD